MTGPKIAPAPLPTWEDLAIRPNLVATMRRYLEQVACVLRPGSVHGVDLALRSFAAFLVECAPEVTSAAQVTRRHVEDYKPWLAKRPGQNKTSLTPATLVHRLGTLRMFFVRIEEWGWDEAPARVPMFLGDLPRQDHPLPKALDDAAAAKLLRAAQNDRRLLVRVTVEVLLRAGLRVSEFTALRADAVVQIGAAPWLHVPVGKLHEDRYLPLHPHVVTLIDDYRTTHVAPENPLLLPRENGNPLNRHSVTRMLNRAGRAAGLPHIHPHQLRHTLATQAINRGMSLEAIAAMLGHRSLDMTLRYAKVANRTVADEYFAVTDKVDALYEQAHTLPADALGPQMAKLRREHHRHLGNGYCARPPELDCAFESICETCAFSRPASTSDPPCKPNTTTPSPRAKTTAQRSSTSCSTPSTTAKHREPLDTDHPHNADERAAATRGRFGRFQPRRGTEWFKIAQILLGWRPHLPVRGRCCPTTNGSARGTMLSVDVYTAPPRAAAGSSGLSWRPFGSSR